MNYYIVNSIVNILYHNINYLELFEKRNLEGVYNKIIVYRLTIHGTYNFWTWLVVEKTKPIPTTIL